MGHAQNGLLYVRYMTSFTNTKAERCKTDKSLHYSIVKHGTPKVVLYIAIAFLNVEAENQTWKFRFLLTFLLPLFLLPHAYLQNYRMYILHTKRLLYYQRCSFNGLHAVACELPLASCDPEHAPQSLSETLFVRNLIHS